MNIGEISENKNRKNPKLRPNLNQIRILKQNLKLYEDRL